METVVVKVVDVCAKKGCRCKGCSKGCRCRCRCCCCCCCGCGCRCRCRCGCGCCCCCRCGCGCGCCRCRCRCRCGCRCGCGCGCCCCCCCCRCRCRCGCCCCCCCCRCRCGCRCRCRCRCGCCCCCCCCGCRCRCRCGCGCGCGCCCCCCCCCCHRDRTPRCHNAHYSLSDGPNPSFLESICPASDALCIAGLKQAGACGRRPGQVSRGGGKQPKKNTLEASKGNQNQPYLIQLREGLPTVFPPSSRFCCPVFFLPPTVSDTVGFGYPQTVAAKDGPPDINSPNVHVYKNPESVKNIGFTSFSSCFYNQVRSLSPTVSDTVRPPETDQGDSWYIPRTPPKSKIRNPKFPNPKSKIQTFSAGFRGFWILDRYYVAFLYVRPPPPQILDFPGDFGFWSLM